MASSDVTSLLAQLDDEIDDLDEALSPLLKISLADSASKLPLLDKAKLYVLITYAIESTLFSYLRLNGVNARAHPVFQELTRVKQYFDKIKNIEYPPERKLNLDKAAAARFVKAGLAGNSKIDLDLAEKRAKDRAKAHLRFDEPTGLIAKKHETDGIKKIADADLDNSDSSASGESSDVSSGLATSEDKRRQAGREASSDLPKVSISSNSASGHSVEEQGGGVGVSVKPINAEGKKGTRTKRAGRRAPKRKKQSGDDESSQGERHSKTKKRAR